MATDRTRTDSQRVKGTDRLTIFSAVVFAAALATASCATPSEAGNPCASAAPASGATICEKGESGQRPADYELPLTDVVINFFDQ